MKSIVAEESGASVHWEKLAGLLPGVRSLLLTLAAIASLSLAAFLVSIPLGFAVMGILLFVLEYLSQPEQPKGGRA